MIDYGTRQTDLAVKRTEWRLSRVYRQAQRDIDEKLKDWQKRHEEREKRYRQQVKDGKITQADFDAWMRGQVFQDKQWQARKAEIDRILLNADREAQRIVNEGKIGVFADNANYIGYDLERNGNVNTGFTLYDQNTVGRLIKSDPQILPKPAPGVQKDKAYTYYNKLMNSAITQGIVQGETIPQIAKRIIDKTGESTYKSAVRNARTAYTGAQNAGRMEGLHQAQALGIKVKKQWVATLDDRTRDTHADLDGQIAEVDEPFITSEGEEIMYPGDPTAAPGEVYNCRCTLVYVYPDYPSDMSDGEPTGDASFEEWEDMKREDQEQEDVSEDVTEQDNTVVDGEDISDTWERRQDEFDFEINDVIDAQGFDGNPRVVDADEFDRAVQESGFIAQRSYSAPDQETIDAYREQLYNGDWYVDCGTGGAQYGQGMYCAADYTGTLSEGIKTEMEHYRELGESRYEDGGLSYTETLTLTPDAKIISFDDLREEKTRFVEDYFNREIDNAMSGASDIEKAAFRYTNGIDTREDRRILDDFKWDDRTAYRDMMDENRDRWHSMFSGISEKRRYYDNMDDGVYAAMRGYDAINAEGHGASGSYTVILNRTKVIFRRP